MFNPMITEGRYIVIHKLLNQIGTNPFQFTNYLNTILSISMPCISFSIYVVMICSMYIKHGRVNNAFELSKFDQFSACEGEWFGRFEWCCATSGQIYKDSQIVQM